MIPSDHFVRFYNEVFKTLQDLGPDHLVEYWRELGRLQSLELADRFRAGGLQACYDYWARIVHEENCEADIELTDDYFECRMRRCPSLSKVLDNDADACELYCDHCMAWVEPVMQAAGLYAVMDMQSRSEPHCVFRVYRDAAAAREFEKTVTLLSKPYGGGEKTRDVRPETIDHRPIMQTKPSSDDLRLAMLGCTAGNGHPYSWSAMFNGYDRERMTRECPFAGIPAYLNQQPEATLTIPGARVTHVCCTGDGGFSADHVAACSLIPKVVSKPEAVIGHVDAVVIATDNGAEHVDRARPFVEAGLPVFVDKPLADNAPDLQQFIEWVDAGKMIMSSSCMRYAKEFMPYRASTRDLGELRFVSITTPKTWERYGIHALEAVYPILGPGFVSVRNTGTPDRNVVHIKHRCGADVIVVASADMYGAFGCLQLCGTAGHVQVAFKDSFFSFKTQLEAFIEFLRTGIRPFPFAETVELMQLVIAGIRSRNEGGREVDL